MPQRTVALVTTVVLGLLGGVVVGCSSPAPPADSPLPTPSASASASGSASATTTPSASASASTLVTASAEPSTSTSATTVADWRTGPTVKGVDVSTYQRTVDWGGLWATGHRFVFVKATEGSTWRSPLFESQRDGARAVGMLVGAYHYARPATSSAIAQARHFVAVSGGWRADGTTLPGALDLERNDGADPCYGLSPTALAAWVREFAGEYRRLTGRPPIVYVKAQLWAECLAGDTTVGAVSPLWLFDHDPPVGPLPSGWSRPTFWQRGIEANLDRNVFFGTEAELARFATMP